MATDKITGPSVKSINRTETKANVDVTSNIEKFIQFNGSFGYEGTITLINKSIGTPFIFQVKGNCTSDVVCKFSKQYVLANCQVDIAISFRQTASDPWYDRIGRKREVKICVASTTEAGINRMKDLRFKEYNIGEMYEEVATSEDTFIYAPLDDSGNARGSIYDKLTSKVSETFHQCSSRLSSSLPVKKDLPPPYTEQENLKTSL